MRGGKIVAGARLAARVAVQVTAGAIGGRRSDAGHAVTVEEPSELSEFRYCTSFLITGDAIDREVFEAFLLPMGDSALVVGDERTVKVHVHVNDPGVVLSEALKHGSIGDIEINDMHAQTRERDERLRLPRRPRRRRSAKAAPSSSPSSPAPAISSSSATWAATRSSTAASP